MTQETIVAIYDSAYAAGAACAELVDAGLPDDAVTWTSAASTQVEANRRPHRERSFWSTLFGGEPDHDTVVYDRSVESGSDVLTVRVPGEHVATCIAILEKHRPIDIDERARSYRLTPRDVAAVDDDTIYDGVDAALPLSREQLPVGGRLVDRGTTRVRRFVVELPVEQNLAVHATRASLTETDEVPALGRTARPAEDIAARADDTITAPGTTRPR